MTTTCTPSNSVQETANIIKPRYLVDAGKDLYEVRVALPGVRKDSVNVNLEKDVLTIRAARKPIGGDGWKALHRELGNASYALRLKLNAPVDESAMTAKLEDGVLILTMPVKETAKPA